MAEEEERIVMTPTKKTSRSTTLVMERKCFKVDDKVVHVAGGTNKGIVVNKEAVNEKDDPFHNVPAHLSLEFRVFLVNQATKKYTQEKRSLAFWFKHVFRANQRTTEAQEFFKKLVSPDDFPRDYVGFIKKIMKLMQREYPMIAKIEVNLTQEKEMDQLPNRPIQEPKEEVRPAALLEAIEQAYPNSLTVDDMSQRFKVEKELVKSMVMELVTSQLVKPIGVAGVQDVDSGATAYRRVHGVDESAVTVVRQMPVAADRANSPSIAVITRQYHEKLAVDAVMTNKQTFLRYATVGEANVYTLGDLGNHRVVTTKLPMTRGVGGGKDETLIATGSTTTRLLGTFQGVEYVFLVGVGGGVPHFADFDRHVRLGDVVVATPAVNASKSYIYQTCKSVRCDQVTGETTFETKDWCPVDLELQQLAQDLVSKFDCNPSSAPWLNHYVSALNTLHAEGQLDEGWTRPEAHQDKLYMSVGGGDVIEVGHPLPRDGRQDPRTLGDPVVHLGPMASIRNLTDEHLRQTFAAQNHTRCFDTAELNSVLDSIQGNRKDRFMVIRGASDYGGVQQQNSKEWQQYSALMAAAVFRAIVEEMPPPEDD